MYELSVIVSTWRRPHILEEVLTALSNQTFNSDLFEVIVIDSNSGDGTEQVVDEASNLHSLNMKYVNVDINAIAVKRNRGINEASGKFIVFLDDDCVPDINHLEIFYKSAKKFIGKKIAWCGGVRFDDLLVKKSNYYRYRDSCHFSKNKPKPTSLSFQQIVTMNMLLERKILLDNNIFFDERYIGYGFEDIQFGLDLVNNGYELIPCEADILHKEIYGDIKKFRIKFFHAGRDGMAVFKKISPNYVNDLGKSALLEPVNSNDKRSTKVLLYLLHLLLDSKFPKIIANILLSTDKYSYLYSTLAYRVTLAGAYREGVRARTDMSKINADRANKDGWYQ